MGLFLKVTARQWNKYISSLRKINNAATEKVLRYLDRYGPIVTPEDMNDLIDFCFSVSTKYGSAAASLCAEWYDAVAALSGHVVPSAIPAPPATIGEVARAVVGTAQSGNDDLISSAVGRLVKMAGVDTTMYNAIRDGAQWAWIPVGDTCAFCVTLASRGWQNASKKALKGGHAEHIHANCDCTYAIRFDDAGTVEGYDPDKWRGMYFDADLDGDTPTPKNRVNALRREIYAENREKILEQKRSAYEKRRELESSAAEEIKA